MEDILYWLWMSDVLGQGSPSTGIALARYGGARDFYNEMRAGLRPDFMSRAAMTVPVNWNPPTCRGGWPTVKPSARPSSPRRTPTTPGVCGGCPTCLLYYM